MFPLLKNEKASRAYEKLAEGYPDFFNRSWFK